MLREICSYVMRVRDDDTFTLRDIHLAAYTAADLQDVQAVLTDDLNDVLKLVD